VVGAAATRSLGLMLSNALRSLPTLVPLNRTAPYAHAVWITVLAFVAVSTAVIMNAPAPHIVYKGF
jgi:hypothetical protein